MPVALVLQRQHLVVDEPTGASETAHLPLLLASRMSSYLKA